MTEHAKHWLDWTALAVTIGAIAQWLPAMAAFVSIVWYCIRIYEWARSGRASDARDTGDGVSRARKR
jgi:hypothetical protein